MPFGSILSLLYQLFSILTYCSSYSLLLSSNKYSVYFFPIDFMYLALTIFNHDILFLYNFKYSSDVFNVPTFYGLLWFLLYVVMIDISIVYKIIWRYFSLFSLSNKVERHKCKISIRSIFSNMFMLIFILLFFYTITDCYQLSRS